MLRKGFTMLELIFVIVILGILSKFGVDLLAKIYENYVFSGVQNRLQSESEMAVRQIANRLQYRIKDSVIARGGVGGTIYPIGNTAIPGTTVLEWIGIDIDGWRGSSTNTDPLWSGFIDLDSSSAAALATPGTSSIPTDSAIFFIGSNVDLGSNFGWGGEITTQNASMHRVTLDTTTTPLTFNSSLTTPPNDTFTGVDVYEYYQLARSAFAVSHEDTDGNGIPDALFLYHDYQPWSGDDIATATERTKTLLMENVETFKFRSGGDTIQVQVCVTDNDITGEGAYAICKEKTIF
jgi:prepilin-type N-terminal cleavage/methylation domain-containing protein